MPEIALGYLVGFVWTAGLVALHLFLQIKKMNGPAMKMLQKNLLKINLFWSESEASVKQHVVGIEESDRKKTIRSILISGTGFTFLSWLGFAMQFTLMLSLRYLAVKRIETRLFESDLVEKEVASEICREIVNKIMQA